MKEPMVITMAREYASGGSEIAQAVADKLGIPLYNKELITLAAKKSGLTEEAIAASENQRSGSLIYSLYMMGNTMPLADQVYILQSNVIKELAEQLSEYISAPIYKTYIRSAVAVEEAQANRADIFDYAGKSTVAEDYRSFIEEFLKGVNE